MKNVIRIGALLILAGCGTTAPGIRLVQDDHELRTGEGFVMIGNFGGGPFEIQFELHDIAGRLKGGLTLTPEQLRKHTLRYPKGGLEDFHLFPLRAERYTFVSVRIDGVEYNLKREKNFRVRPGNVNYIGHMSFSADGQRLSWNIWDFEKRMMGEYRKQFGKTDARHPFWKELAK